MLGLLEGDLRSHKLTESNTALIFNGLICNAWIKAHTSWVVHFSKRTGANVGVGNLASGSAL